MSTVKPDINTSEFVVEDGDIFTQPPDNLCGVTTGVTRSAEEEKPLLFKTTYVCRII
ncbi:MAG: hypothetical protein GX808_08975 [Syntrophomonadaceae bacterium]|nr:hypothetical protein [Syntrophomonadaceae bacterium]